MSVLRGALAQRLAEAQIATMTLTRLPAGMVADPAPSSATAAWAFPLVGLVVGGLSALGYAVALALYLPPAIAALVAIAIATIATGAIHEDGLADLADGLGGGRDRAGKLAIMRDSHVGTYGMVALVLSLAIRGVCIAAISTPLAAVCALLALAAASRAAMVVALFAMPPARSDGLGQAAADVDAARCAAAVGFGLAALILLTTFSPAVAVAMLAFGALPAWLAWRQIGGQTGDVLGAVQQLAEIGGWLAVVGLSAGLA